MGTYNPYGSTLSGQSSLAGYYAPQPQQYNIYPDSYQTPDYSGVGAPNPGYGYSQFNS